MARIGVDAFHLSRSGKGLSRFTECILQEVFTKIEGHEFVVFVNGRAELPDLPAAPYITYVPVGSPKTMIWEQVQLPWLVSRYRLDLLQSLSDRLPLFCVTPIVLYLFEIPDHRYLAARSTGPRMSRYERWSGELTRRLFYKSTRTACRLLVSSRSTYMDLRKFYHTPEDKISVIYPGPDRLFLVEEGATPKTIFCEELGAHEGYILHFSSINDPRDNTEIALRAYHASLALCGHGRKLVIVGHCNLEVQGLAGLVRELALTDSILLPGYVSSERVVEFYRNADLYLDPSLFEGFGFQVLEAMVCGTPVVCSNSTSLPEVVGEAGLLVAPTDVEGFAQAIVRVLSDPGQAQEMRRRGVERAGLFNWQEVTRRLSEVYDQLT